MVTIEHAESGEQLAEIRRLFTEYARSLDIDLGFQDFERELATLPGPYARPAGCLLLATIGGRPVGCVGVRLLEADVCEMKRLFVRPETRGEGVGRSLAEAAVAFGRAAGYRIMRLDTLPTMVAAQALYRTLGFGDIPPYRFNPAPGTLYMELALEDRSA